MPTGSLPWQEIAMDFVGELPDSEGFNAILVITDRFTKCQRYIAAKTTWNARDVADVLINEIYRFYGLPKSITSDRGPQFASECWQEIHKQLDIMLRISTAHYPQTDGLSEQAVQTLKQYLRIYCYNQQGEWLRYLPMAEFAYNSSKAIHGYSPFFALYGWNPKAVHYDDNEEIGSPAAEEWLNRMVNVHKQIHETLKKINNKRSKLHIEKSHQFVKGDMVYIDRRNLRI